MLTRTADEISKALKIANQIKDRFHKDQARKAIVHAYLRAGKLDLASALANKIRLIPIMTSHAKQLPGLMPRRIESPGIKNPRADKVRL